MTSAVPLPAASETGAATPTVIGTGPVVPPLPWLLTVVAFAVRLNCPGSVAGTMALLTVRNDFLVFVYVQLTMPLIVDMLAETVRFATLIVTFPAGMPAAFVHTIEVRVKFGSAASVTR